MTRSNVERSFPELEFKTVAATDLAPKDLARVLELFDACYRQANHAYVEKSLGRLRFVTLAFHEGSLVGFAFGDLRVMDLPRLAQQNVIMAGLSCVAAQFRRRGLFGELERRAIVAGERPVSGRILMCGRMAHPAAFRVMSGNPNVVPSRGVRPSPWHQEVGRLIADTYGVDAFDPETFVCKGTGTPIGYPILDVDVEPWEWEVFRPVDRDRGDSLLGMAWSPDAPPGW